MGLIMLGSKRAYFLFEEARSIYTEALKHLDEAIAELDRGEFVKAA